MKNLKLYLQTTIIQKKYLSLFNFIMQEFPASLSL